MLFNRDDSPLYLFESSIENHTDFNEFIKEYTIPKYFKEDLFNSVNMYI